MLQFVFTIVILWHNLSVTANAQISNWNLLSKDVIEILTGKLHITKGLFRH